MASSHPAPKSSAVVWPVTARHRGWSSTNAPSGDVVQTMAAVASTSERYRASSRTSVPRVSRRAWSSVRVLTSSNTTPTERSASGTASTRYVRSSIRSSP